MRCRRGWLRIRPQDLTPQGIARLSRAVCRMDGLVALAHPAAVGVGPPGLAVSPVSVKELVTLLSGIARHPDAGCGQGVRLGDLVGSLAIRPSPMGASSRGARVVWPLKICTPFRVTLCQPSRAAVMFTRE